MRVYELRLAWANKQTHTLEKEIAAWKDRGGYGVVFEPQPNSPMQTIRLKADDPPDYFSLIVSDTLHTLRAALNALAYDLAIARHAPKPVPDSVADTLEFPIFGDRPMNAEEEKRKIGGIDPKAQTVIKGLQPHLEGKQHVGHPLWHLHELARLDRHRLPHFTIATLGGVGIGGDNLHIETMILSHTGLAEDGAKLGECAVRPIDPGQPMQMNVTPEPQLRFKEEPFRGEIVLDLLEGIKTEITTNIVPPLSKFL